MIRSIFFGAAFALCGCEASNLYVAHDAVVGVSAQVSADRQQGRLIIGYDRDFITIIPKSVDNADAKRDAMALLGCTRLKVGGIFLSEYTDVIASGEAAKRFAQKVNDDDAFFDCLRQRDATGDDE